MNAFGKQAFVFRQQQLDSLIPYLLRAKNITRRLSLQHKQYFKWVNSSKRLKWKHLFSGLQAKVFLKHDFTWDASWCESKQKIENISWRNLSFSVPTVCGSSRPNITLKQSYTTNLIIFYSSYNSYKCKYTLHAIHTKIKVHLLLIL